MALTKTQKQTILTSLKEKITKQKAIVFAVITGLKVKDLTELRRQMKKNDCELKVAKKTLIASALKDNGLSVDVKKLEGEIALGFGYKDEIIPFKTIYDFSKTNEHLKILGGIINKEILEPERAIAFGQLPAKEELLAKMVGSLAAPMTGLMNVLQGNIKGLVVALSAISNKKQINL